MNQLICAPLSNIFAVNTRPVLGNNRSAARLPVSLSLGVGASSDHRVSTRTVYSASCVTPTREDMSGNTMLVPQASVTDARDGQPGVSRNGEIAGGRPTGSDSGVSNNGDAQGSDANTCDVRISRGPGRDAPPEAPPLVISDQASDGTPVSLRSRNVSPCSVSGVSDPSSAPSVAVTRASDFCDAVSSLSSVTVTRAERKPVSSSRRRGDDPTEDDNRVARGASSATYPTASLCPGAGASSGRRVSTRAVNFALNVTPTRVGMSGLARVDNPGNSLSVLHANFTIASEDQPGVPRRRACGWRTRRFRAVNIPLSCDWSFERSEGFHAGCSLCTQCYTYARGHFWSHARGHSWKHAVCSPRQCYGRT